MKKRDYLISRDNVYIGELVATNSIYSYLTGNNTSVLRASSWNHLRSIIFSVNDTGYANDLLYDSPKYPILNITPDKEIDSSNRESIVIRAPFNLLELLKYYNYPEELTYKDIVKMRNKFFNGTFTYNNSQLFGYEKMSYQEYMDMVRVGDREKEIAILKAIKRLLSYKEYYKIYEGDLSRELWHVLNARSDNTGLLNIKSVNNFTPSREEKIKIKNK